MKIVFANFLFLVLVLTASSTVIFIWILFGLTSLPKNPQYPEINDQFEESNHTELLAKSKITENRHTEVDNTRAQNTKSRRNEINTDTDTEIIVNDDNITVSLETTQLKEFTLDDVANSTLPQLSFITKLYNIITLPFIKLASTPKVRTVIRNIGTCIVNGAMEIVSFFFPAPLIPLIASAAGLVIPFEPVVMLREKMPVTSYRRAFKTAVDGFLGTFDQYKYEDEDPYMTRRFNRRFMGPEKSDGDKVE